MSPIVVHLGPLTIRWYGVMVALAFLVGLALTRQRAPRFGISKDLVSDLLFWAMLGGIAGARIMFIAHNWRYFQANPLEMIMIHHGGLVFYGGFAGAGLAIWLLCHRHHVQPLLIGDLLVPALPLGHVLGRIGCFLNGCCHGRPWQHGVCYNAQHYDAINVQISKGLQEPGALEALPVLPIQLIAAAANLLIFAGLLRIEKHLPYRGQLLAIYLLSYGIMRFVVEFGRGDYASLIGGLLTPAQVICLAVTLPLGAALFVRANQLKQPSRRPAGDGALL